MIWLVKYIGYFVIGAVAYNISQSFISGAVAMLLSFVWDSIVDVVVS